MSPSWHSCHSFMRHSFIPPFLNSRPSPEQRLCGHLLPCLFSGAPAERAACSWITLIHTDTHDMNLDLSTTGTPFPPSKPQFVHMLQRRPGPTSPRPYTASPCRRSASHPRARQMLPPPSQHLAAFGPPSKPRHSSRAEPQQALNPFSFSFGKENKQGM